MTATIDPIPHALIQYDLNIFSSRGGIYFSTLLNFSLNLLGPGDYFDGQNIAEMILC